VILKSIKYEYLFYIYIYIITMKTNISIVSFQYFYLLKYASFHENISIRCTFSMLHEKISKFDKKLKILYKCWSPKYFDNIRCASNKNPNISTHDIQYHFNQIFNWTKKWIIKINENKSVQINFSLSRNEFPQLSLNNVPIPIQNVTKYLGVYLDKIFTWAQHSNHKKIQSNTRLHLLRPLLSPSMSLKNKLLIYKTIITPL